jgi:hypothetical protein
MLSTKALESRLRRRAARERYIIRKSRRFDSIDNFGEYMLVDASLNIPVLGYRYDATLHDIAVFLEAPEAEYFE